MEADNEWIYFGDGKGVNENIVIEAIISHFKDDSLFLVSTRQDSFKINQKDKERIIGEVQKFTNLFIWDKNFKRVIEFNYIGVMRCGEIRNN